MFKKIKQLIISSRKTSYIMRHGLDDYLYARVKYGEDWYDQTNLYNRFVLDTYSDQRMEKYEEYIKHCLKKSKLKEFQDILITIIHKNCKQFEEQYMRAIEIIKNSKAGCLHPADWSALESFVLSQGFFVLGLECHKKYQKSVLLQKDRIFRGFSKFAVLLELGRGEDALKELNDLDKKRILQRYRSRTLYMARLYCNALNHIPQKPIPPFKEDAVTIAYGKYLKEKRLLLIGPAPTDFSDNEYDIILRMNDAENDHKGKEPLGRNTDISYFCEERTDKEIAAGQTFSKLRFAVWKNRFNRVSEKYTNSRGTICCSEILTIGHFNMIPITLSDLLRFDWKELKIIGTSLWIGNKIYSNDYIRSKENTSIEDFLDGNSIHNVFSQFFFLQNMYKAGIFKADNSLCKILTDTAATYAKQMEQSYLLTFRD